MKTIFYSIIALSFVACGGSSSSGGASVKDDSLLSSNIPNNILIVEGMKKDVKITSLKDNLTYNIVNDKNILDIEIDKNRGIVYFWSNGAVGSTVTAVVEASDKSGWKSKPLSLVFQTVPKNIAPNMKVLKTGSASDGGAGVARNFTVEGEYIRDPFGNVWENRLDKKKAKASLYQLAENRCAVLKSIHPNSNWRVPTADELLNLVDYNNSGTTSIIDNVFEKSSLNLWVESKDGKYQVFSQTSGLISDAKFTDKYAVRCINAPKKDVSHIVSSGTTIGANTYDFSTGLMWSFMDKNSKRKIVDDINENAFEYCANYDNASGWRLPNINEVHSIIEGDTISSNILGSNTIIVSATPYISSDPNAKAANYIVGIENNKILYGVSYADMSYPITCVKEIP